MNMTNLLFFATLVIAFICWYGWVKQTMEVKNLKEEIKRLKNDN